MSKKMWEGHVLKVLNCGNIVPVSGPFYVIGDDVEAATCALGTAILQAREAPNGDYRELARNLAMGVKWHCDYTILLNHVGFARPGVHSCC